MSYVVAPSLHAQHASPHIPRDRGPSLIVGWSHGVLHFSGRRLFADEMENKKPSCR